MRTVTVSLGVLLAAVCGCGHNVGDSCTQNVDCSPLGDRFCDLSAPGGYCTLEGCDIRLDTDGNNADSCPSESECVRFFTQIETEPCDPTAMPTGCNADERCLCDCSNPDTGACLPVGSVCPNGDKVVGPQPGHCAPETSERRWCMLRCSKDSDCRSDTDAQGQRLYECRAFGTFGAEQVPFPNMSGSPPSNEPSKFCVQRQSM
jgi:hypothetical protein